MVLARQGGALGTYLPLRGRHRAHLGSLEDMLSEFSLFVIVHRMVGAGGISSLTVCGEGNARLIGR